MKIEQNILKRAYDAFNQRDIDAVLNLMQPDVDWANGMDGRRILGREAVREYWTRQWETFDPNVEPLNFTIEADRRVCVIVHSIVRDLEGNIIHDGEVEHLYSFENSLVKRMEIRELFKKIIVLKNIRHKL